MRISDWRSDVCSSDLFGNLTQLPANTAPGQPKTQPGFDEASQRLIQAAMFNAIGATGTSIVNAIISGGDVGPLAKNLGVSGFMLGEFVAQILPEEIGRAHV